MGGHVEHLMASAYPLLRPRAVEELWFAEHGEGDLIALREKELQQRMMAIRNDDAPKPIGTSGNTEEATEPEDDEYQSDDSDDMDGEGDGDLGGGEWGM